MYIFYILLKFRKDLDKSEDGFILIVPTYIWGRIVLGKLLAELMDIYIHASFHSVHETAL